MAALLRHFIRKATTLPKVRAVRKAQVAAHKIQTREYDEKVVDHFKNPRNVGSLDTVWFGMTLIYFGCMRYSKQVNVGTGLVGAPACGDVMKFQIEVDENDNIVGSCFKTFGCGSAIASSSFATDKVKGMSLQDASKLSNKEIAKELNLPPVKLHCSMLAEDGIKAAIKDLEKKRKEAAASSPTVSKT